MLAIAMYVLMWRGLSLCVCLLVTIVSHAKTAEPIQIEMSFGKWTRGDPKNHVLYRAHIGTTWRIRWIDFVAAAMRPYATITIATCYFYY